MSQHLVAPAQRWREVPRWVANVDGFVAICFDEGSTPMLIAANAQQWSRPVAPWITVSRDYPASLAARELGTLSWIVDLTDIVLSSDDDQLEHHARIVHELLTSDPATIETPVATLVAAYNRPLPPLSPTIWLASGTAHDERSEFVSIFTSPTTSVMSDRIEWTHS